MICVLFNGSAASLLTCITHMYGSGNVYHPHSETQTKMKHLSTLFKIHI